MLQVRRIPYYVFERFQGFPSACSIMIDHSRNLVIATEIANNTGTSITNAVDLLGNKICEEFELNKHELIWIERYTKQSNKKIDHDGDCPSYSLVHFELKNGYLVRGQHKYIKPENFKRDFDRYNIDLPSSI